MKKLVIAGSVLILLTGCGNLKVSTEDSKYRYVSCDENYLNLKDMPITHYRTVNSSSRIHINTEDGRMIISSERCVLSENKLWD